MPIPKPKSREKQSQFMMRCVAKMMGEYPKEQAIAICYNSFRASEQVELETYNDYPQSAVNNAKKVLKWVEKNGWGSCGNWKKKSEYDCI